MWFTNDMEELLCSLIYFDELHHFYGFGKKDKELHLQDWRSV